MLFMTESVQLELLPFFNGSTVMKFYLHTRPIHLTGIRNTEWLTSIRTKAGSVSAYFWTWVVWTGQITVPDVSRDEDSTQRRSGQVRSQYMCLMYACACAYVSQSVNWRALIFSHDVVSQAGWWSATLILEMYVCRYPLSHSLSLSLSHIMFSPSSVCSTNIYFTICRPSPVNYVNAIEIILKYSL